MITKLNTLTGYLRVTMPANLSELSLQQLIDLQNAKELDDLTTVSILSGTPIADLQNVKTAQHLDVFRDHITALAAQIPQVYNGGTVPDRVSFLINDRPKVVKVMKNLSVEPAGAFMASREIIADEISKHIQEHGEADWQENFSPSLSACARLLAQYFYCRATGKPYNEYAAAEFEEQVKLLPVTNALPIAKYFFLSYPNLSKPKTGFWHRLHRLWNSARGSKTSSRLNISTPSTPSPAAM